MLQILINTSIIWLCSLLVYELLLKKETFHRLNRYYLLFTFIAGMGLPLLPWGQQAQISSYQTSQSAPVAAGNVVPATVTPVIAEAQPQKQVPWLPVLYGVGIGVSILFLLRDLLRLRAWYRRAVLTRSGPWTIAETGVSHGPFSFGKIIFVCSREQYTDQQWAMLLQHEQQHYRYRHILDLALMQVALTLLWFHPLVYIYRQKLRLLHEYEVDSTQPGDLQTYGRFLLEQAALRSAPVMTHAFNFSPLKNRIHMMTRNTSKRRVQYRLLLLLPMLAGFMYCCAQNKTTLSIDIKDDKVSRKDAMISFTQPGALDTVYIEDIETHERKMVVSTTDPRPEKLNGQLLIYSSELGLEPKCLEPGEKFSANYLIGAAGLDDIFRKMPEGAYNFMISKTVIAPDGKVVYYEVTMPWPKKAPGTPLNSLPPASPLSEADKAALHRKLADVFMGSNISFTPGKDKSGNSVPYYQEGGRFDFSLSTSFTVKDHQVIYTK
jgi:hypothetical protein